MIKDVPRPKVSVGKPHLLSDNANYSNMVPMSTFDRVPKGFSINEIGTRNLPSFGANLGDVNDKQEFKPDDYVKKNKYDELQKKYEMLSKKYDDLLLKSKVSETEQQKLKKKNTELATENKRLKDRVKDLEEERTNMLNEQQTRFKKFISISLTLSN